MSKINSKLPEVTEQEKRFWHDNRIVNVFNLFVAGKDIPAISETLSMKKVTVENLIVNKFFVAKLEAHVRSILFTNQVTKVLAASDIFSKLWDRVRDNIEEIPPEICLKELTKLFPTQKEGMIVNPKNMNVFMKVMKGEVSPSNLEERLADMDDDLGFEGLKDDSKAIYPELTQPSEDLSEEKKDGK